MKNRLLKSLLGLLLLFAALGAGATGLTGTKTVGSGKTYANMSAAITDLNTYGVGSGGVTFVVSSGTYTEPFPTITATGTSSNPIRFVTTGGAVTLQPIAAGTVNLSVAYYPGDAVITIKGGSYISFNGFTINDYSAATTNTQRYEQGFLFIKSSATGGCQYDTIQNCTISLTGGTTETYSTGILFTNYSNSTGTSYTISSSSGTNSNNYIYNNTISNCYNGIIFYGYAVTSYSSTTVPYQDQNNTFIKNTMTVGGSSTICYPLTNYYGAGVLTEKNNTITCTAGQTTTCYGIENYYGYGATVTCTGNTITENSATSGTVSGTFYGIYNYYCGYNGSGTSGSAVISNNKVTLNLGSGTNSNSFYGIEDYYGGYNNVNGGNGYGRVSQNSITVVTPVVPTTGTNSGTYYGMYNYYASYGGNWMCDSNTVKYTLGVQSSTAYGIYN